MPEYSPASMSGRAVLERTLAVRPGAGASGVTTVASQRCAVPARRVCPFRRADQMRPSFVEAMAAAGRSHPGVFACQMTTGPEAGTVTGRFTASPLIGTSRIWSMPASVGSPSSCIRMKAPVCRMVMSVSPFSAKVVSAWTGSFSNRASASFSSLTGVPSSKRTGSWIILFCGCGCG